MDDRKPSPRTAASNPQHELQQAFLQVADSLHTHLKSVVDDMVKKSIKDALAGQQKTNATMDNESSLVVSEDPFPGRRKQPKRSVNQPKAAAVLDYHHLPWETPRTEVTEGNNFKLPWEMGNDDDDPLLDPWNSPPSKRAKANVEDDLGLFSLGLHLEPHEHLPPTTTWCVVTPRQADPFWMKHSKSPSLCLVIEAEPIVHIIEYNPEGQVYIIKQLTTLNHYQKRLSDFATTPFLDSKFKDKNVNVHFYPNKSNHKNDFLFIVNQKANGSNAQLKDLLQSMDFPRVKQLLINPSKTNDTSTKRNENSTNLTFGHTSQSYVVNEMGFQIVALSNGSTEKETVNLFKCASQVLQWTSVPEQFRYIPTQDRHYYLRRITSEREHEHPSIVHEALTMSTGLLMEHKDSHNPPPDSGSIANVMGISMDVDGQRYNVGFFNKRSVTDSIKRVNYFTSMCNDFELFYRSLPHCRLPIRINSEIGDTYVLDLINDELAKEIPYPSEAGGVGMPTYYSLPCNIDPTGYHALFVDSLLWMKCNINLSFTDMVGLVSVCFERQSNTGLFLSMAVDDIKPPRRVGSSSPSTQSSMEDMAQTIRYVANAMSKKKAEYDDHCKMQGTNLGIYRFSARNNVYRDIPNSKDIFAVTTMRTAICLYAWKAHPESPPRKHITAVYDSIMRLFQISKQAKIGNLALQHEIAIMSYLGLLPAWVRLHANVEGRLANQLKSMFPQEASTTPSIWTTKGCQRSVMDSIGRNLVNRGCGDTWSTAKVENFLCKFTRWRGGEEGSRGYRYVDIRRHGQIVLEEQFVTIEDPATGKVTDRQHYLKVASSSGMTCVCKKAVLFDKWVFHGQIKTLPEIARDIPVFMSSGKTPVLRMPDVVELKRLVMKEFKFDLYVQRFGVGGVRITQPMHDPFISWPDVVGRRTVT